jgi:iron-regulated transporter 1
MDMLKFLMVILAPYPEEYGLLVFISFAFVCIGWMFYAKYSHSSRGHLLHFEKICSSKQNNNINHEVNEFGSVVMDITIDVNVENEEKKDS